MARIDLLTAQMRQRAVSRVSIGADERMKLFGEGDKLLGAGAALSGQVVGQLLSEIAPVPLDGTPVTFPYNGQDGQFEISVAPGGQSFEMRTVSFAPTQNATTSNTSVQNAPMQTHSQPQSASVPAPVPKSEPQWFYFAGDQQLGPNSPGQIKTLIRQGQVKPDTLLWKDGMTDWQVAAQTEFRTLLPVLPTSPTAAPGTDYFGNPVTTVAPPSDPENTWFYRSATGQSVPLDRAALVAKLRDKSLSPQTLIWREGMSEWQSADNTELAREISDAPIASPSASRGDGYTGPRTMAGTGAYSIYGGGDPNNTSGEGWDAILPQGARGFFNVGAFLFPALWCRAHNLDSWAGGIIVVNVASRYLPFVGLIKIPICLYLGLTGHTHGWRMRRFSDVADFKRCQFLWAVWSAVASVVMWGLLVLFIWSMIPPSSRTNVPNSSTTSSSSSPGDSSLSDDTEDSSSGSDSGSGSSSP